MSMNANERVWSLEEEIKNKDNSLNLSDTVEDKSCDENKLVDRIFINEIINTLKHREKQIIVLRFFMEYTQQRVADILGISQVQVCRLEKKILKNLKTLYPG